MFRTEYIQWSAGLGLRVLVDCRLVVVALENLINYLIWDNLLNACVSVDAKFESGS